MGGTVGVNELGSGQCGGELCGYGGNLGISTFGGVHCGVGVRQGDSFCEQFLTKFEITSMAINTAHAGKRPDGESCDGREDFGTTGGRFRRSRAASASVTSFPSF
jgi:hypothetical protein